MAVAMTGSPKMSPHAPKLWLLVSRMLPRSYLAAMSWKSRVAPSLPSGR